MCLAIAGARPVFLTLYAFIEECLEIDLLDRIFAGESRVILESELRGERVLEEFEDAPLPRSRYRTCIG